MVLRTWYFTPLILVVLTVLHVFFGLLQNVNLNHMNIESLKKFKRIYKLRTRANNTSKSEMVSLVQKHFQTMAVPDEAETIETFIFNIKYAQ